MDIQRQEPEQIKVQLTLTGQEIQKLAAEMATRKKISKMPTLMEVMNGILFRGGTRTAASMMNGKRYRRITHDHLALALSYLKKYKTVAPYHMQRDHIMGWSYAVKSLDSLVRSGQAQCKQSGKRRTYYYTGHLGQDSLDARVEHTKHSRKASYPAILKDRVANSIQLNGLMYMRDIANSVKMSLDEREHLREILDDLICEGKIKDIHSKHGGHPRYAPIDMRIPNR